MVYPKPYILHSGEGLAVSGASRTGTLLLDRGTLSGKKRKSTVSERVLCVTDLSKVGVVEFGWSKAGSRGNHGIKGKGKNKEENLLRALRRARRKVRIACLATRACYILTLTYHENMQDRRQAIYDRQEFDRRMREHYPSWRYVGVLEQQKRGALHWHLAMPFKVDQSIALREWRMVTGDPTITQVHVGFKPNGKGNAFSKCAGYVSKYIGKDMSARDSEEHHYHVARGVSPSPERFVIPPDAPKDTEMRMMTEISHHLLTENFSWWSAPFPAGSPYGYVKVEQDRQPREGG